jgi:digeranylgeranylglycerophospholipid reductase
MARYDVIIVGAGPAGSSTARYIAPRRSGVSVLLLEAKRSVGLPIQCGEALPNYGDVEALFPGADCPELFDLPPDVVASEVRGIRFRLPRGRSCFAPVTGRTVYRDRLDRHLFEQALAAGADSRTGTRVIAVEGHRVVTAADRFEAGIVVGADGPNSLVAASIPGFAPNRLLAPCAFVIAGGDFFERHMEIWIDQRFPGGYFWIFPKNGEANIGVGVRGATHVRPLLKRMLERISAETPFRTLFAGGGVVPMSGLKARLVSGHAALVGDAAGMVFPTNGGGTAQAMLGGRILGEVIREGLPLSHYQRRIDRCMRPALARSRRTLRLIDLARRSDTAFLALMALFDRRGWKNFLVG